MSQINQQKLNASVNELNQHAQTLSAIQNTYQGLTAALSHAYSAYGSN